MSVSTPRSVADARGVSLFASALPGSSLCLLVSLRVLLAGVLLGFSDSGCSSGWVVAVSFPGLVFCQWAKRPCACCPGLLAGCSYFLPGGRFPFCGFVWGSGFPFLLFILLGPDLDLSLSRPFLLQPLAPGVLLVRACFCLGYFRGLDCPLPSHGGLPIGIPAFLSGSLPVALSHLPGGVRLFCFAGRPSSPFFWFVRGVRCSSWLSPLHSARFSFVVFSVPCGWVGALLPSLRPYTQSLSLWPVGCFPVSSVTLRSCVLSWSLGFSIPWQFPRPGLIFPGSRTLHLPPPWYSRWHLDPAFCSSRVLHPTLSHVFATAFPTVQLVPRFSLFLF